MQIGYWRGMVVPENIERRCDTEIQQLKSGEYKSLRLEKLRGPRTPVFSIRLNNRARLLLALYKGILIALDVLECHEYEGNKYLDNKVLGNFLKNQGEEIEKIDANFEENNGEDIEKIRNKDYQKGQPATAWTALEWHGEEWIVLTTKQKEALNSLPVIVTGPGGAGKSTVAQSLMLAHAIGFGGEKRVLYLSGSKNLVQSMGNHFSQMSPDAPLLIERRATQILTFLELLTEVFHIDSQAVVAPTDFYNWFNQYVKRNPYPLNGETRKPPSVELLWEEITLCAGFKNQEDYFALGRQSILPKGDERSYVYRAYMHYSDYLLSQGLISPELFIPPEYHPFYDLVLVDEAQNCSPAQVFLATRLAQDRQIAFFAGEHQGLARVGSILPYIRWIFETKHQSIAEVSLPFTHRCPHAVIPLINELMRLTRNATGGLADKKELLDLQPVENALQGNAFWYSDWTTELIASLSARASNVGFAIIAAEDDHAHIQEIFPKALCFTVAEAQGLGFDDLVVFNPIKEEPVAKSLFEAVGMKDAKNRPKEKDKPSPLRIKFDELTTTMTRAKGCLTVVQFMGNRWQRQLSEHLRGFLDAPEKGAASESRTAVPSTLEQWKKRVQKLFENGNEKQAKQIWEWYFKDIPYELFKENLVPRSSASPLEKIKLAKPLKKSRTGANPAAEPAESPKVADKPPPAYDQIHRYKKLPSTIGSDGLSNTELDTKKEYLEKLVASFNDTNIGSLLHSKSVIKFLFYPFTYYSKEYPCFLYFIAKNEQYAYKFMDNFKKMSSREKVDFLTNFMRQLTANQKANHIITIMEMFLKPEVINEEMLCMGSAPSEPSELPFTRPFLFWIGSICSTIMSEMWIEFIRSAHQKSPFKAENIGKALCETACFNGGLISANDLEDETTAFSKLAQFEGGHRILLAFLKLLPGLENYILARTLCGPIFTNCTSSCKTELKIPVLYYLSISETGLEILSALLANPAILNGITADAFLKERHCPNHNPDRSSVFSELVFKMRDYAYDGTVIDSTNGQKRPNRQFQVLNRILDNKNIRDAITIKVLRMTPIYQEGTKNPGSLLMWLAENGENSQLILARILEKPSVLEKLNMEDLFSYAYCPPKQVPLIVFAALSYLGVGKSILKKILKVDAIANQITIEHLRRCCYGLPIFMYLLMQGTEGNLEILKRILANPKILHAIKREDLCTFQNGRHISSVESTTPLYWLALNEDGLPYLRQFINNPTILAAIDKDVLFRILPPNQSMFTNTSLFFLLSKTKESIEVLWEIFKRKPSLWDEFSTNALCVLRPNDIVNNVANISALYCLVIEESGLGLAFVEELLKHPNIFWDITPESICAMRPIPGNQTVLASLACGFNPQRREILQRLLENPAILAGITSDSLFLPYLKGGSPFYYLACDGLEILSTLMTNTQLIASLEVEHLLWDIPGMPGMSALLFLSRSKFGCDILKRILDHENNRIKGAVGSEILKRVLPTKESIWTNLGLYDKTLCEKLVRPSVMSISLFKQEEGGGRSPTPGPDGSLSSSHT